MSRFSADKSTVAITFVEPDGTRRSVDAPMASNLMRIAKLSGVNMHARCGGNLRCATCFVTLDQTILENVSAMRPPEQRVIEPILTKHPKARLACQLFVNRHFADSEVSVGVPMPRMDAADDD